MLFTVYITYILSGPLGAKHRGLQFLKSVKNEPKNVYLV